MAEKINLSEFARRAQQRLKDKQVSVKFNVYVPSLEQEMEFRSLLDEEVREIMNMDDEDSSRQDKFLIYTASVEPSLQDVATELRQAGDITDYLQVVDMFPIRDINTLSKLILEKSGVLGGEKPHIVEKAVNDLKN